MPMSEMVRTESEFREAGHKEPDLCDLDPIDPNADPERGLAAATRAYSPERAGFTEQAEQVAHQLDRIQTAIRMGVLTDGELADLSAGIDLLLEITGGATLRNARRAVLIPEQVPTMAELRERHGDWAEDERRAREQAGT